MRNLPALDGYRGLAILLVILFHAGWLPVGWVGVQLFFILSSFLITSILREERARPAGEFFGKFWARRARRLCPLYFVYLLIVGVLLRPDGFARHAAGLATFTFNFSQILLPPMAGSALGHLWLPAVAAQFFLVWPLAVRALGERGLRRLALVLICVAPAARFGGDLFLSQLAALLGSPTAPNFLLPIAHLDAFGWGAFLALPRGRDGRGWLIAVMAAVLSLVCAPFAGRAVWTFSLVTAGGALLLHTALHPATAHLFSAGWLRFTGRISSGLYVWHYVFVEGITRWLGGPQTLLASAFRLLLIFAASYALAALSFFAWERRFLRGARK